MTMSVRDLIPWGREESRVPSQLRDSERDPFLSLHREVNRLFDDVFRGFGSGLPSVGGASAFGGSWHIRDRRSARIARFLLRASAKEPVALEVFPAP
jgi:hypothetical protein